MNGTQLLSPWGLAWAGAAAAILALYLLRPRSRRVEVSSILLWRRTLELETSRSPLAWLRRHALLLMQVAAALLVALALARPTLSRLVPVPRTVAIIVDTSAPMLASDGDPGIVADGPFASAVARRGVTTRLDEAKARAALVVSRLRSGDRAVIVAVAGAARVDFSGEAPGDTGALISAIGRLVAQPGEANLSQAVEIAGAAIRDARQGEVVIVTGGVADLSGPVRRPPVPIQVVRVGKSTNPDGPAPSNAAITALVARRPDLCGDTICDLSATPIQAFVRVQNRGASAANGTLRLRVDGKPFGERPLTVGGDASEAISIPNLPSDASWIEAWFDTPDLLALDNLATAAVPRPVTRRVALVGGRTDQLERALRAVPGVVLERIDPARYDPTARYDVVVFEAWFPPQAPQAHWFLVDPPRTDGPIVVNGNLGKRTDSTREWNSAQVARVRPGPLLAGVDFAGVSVTEARQVAIPDWAEEVVSARASPLIFMGYPGAYRAVVVAFDLRSSNLLGRVGFPVLISNTIEWLTGGAEVTTGSDGAIMPGDALPITPLPRTTAITIEMPTGEIRRIETPGSTGRPSVRFLDTAAPGAYVVREFEQSDEIARHVTIARAVPAGREAALADLRPRAKVLALASVGPGAEPGPLLAGPGETTERDEWWQWAAIISLVIVAAEWWWFSNGGSRRVRVARADPSLTYRASPTIAGVDVPLAAVGAQDASVRVPERALAGSSDVPASSTAAEAWAAGRMPEGDRR
jgi:hypothetical protein